MAGFRSSKALICACFLLTSLLLVPAVGKKGEEGEGEKEVCEKGEVNDDEGECCSPKMIGWEEEKELCQKPIDPMNVAVAFTLIGSFTFLISLQFFTGHPDEDMKKYAYKVISSTVSIFCAVLMFQCFNGLVEHFIIENIERSIEDSKWIVWGVDFSHMLIWYLITQIVLAFASTVPQKSEQSRAEIMAKKKSPIPREQEEFEKEAEDLEANCMSYGVVCAHLTGFASINAWTALQSLAPFNSSPWMALCPMLLALVGQNILQRMTNMVREKIIAGDGERDIFEEKWDDQCEEAEDDVLGLTLSVVIVNSVRYAINGMVSAGKGCLPNEEQKEEGEACEEFLGEEKEGRHLSQIAALAGAGLIFSISLFFVKLIQLKFFPEEEEKEEKEEEGIGNRESQTVEEAKEEEEQKGSLAEMVDRFSEVVVIVLSMAFSWCTFHANKQLLMWLNPDYLGDEDQATTLALVLALEVTYLGFITIRILDKISDLPDEYTPAAVDDSIKAVIDAIALFIGFAWEQTFDESVDALAGKSRKFFGPDAPAISKFLLGSMISCFIFVAWKKFQVPFIVKQGWKFNYVFSATDLVETVQKLDEGSTFKSTKSIYSKLSAAVRSVHDPEAGTSEYRALPGEDSEALRRKNTELMTKLEQAEQEKLKAQQTLDSFMENMLVSLKGMNETVTRIEMQ